MKIYTFKEMQEELRYGSTLLRILLRQGKIPGAYKDCSRWKITQEDLNAYIQTIKEQHQKQYIM